MEEKSETDLQIQKWWKRERQRQRHTERMRELSVFYRINRNKRERKNHLVTKRESAITMEQQKLI